MIRSILFSHLVFLTLNCQVQSQTPTKTDIRYSQKFERSVLDLWMTESKKALSSGG